jgi:hypothetical protein
MQFAMVGSFCTFVCARTPVPDMPLLAQIGHALQVWLRFPRFSFIARARFARFFAPPALHEQSYIVAGKS